MSMIDRIILHYHILEKIGEGGMGVVYKAMDTKLNREVAIKFLPNNYAVNEKDKVKLKTEAQIAASLNHPNVATIYAIEEYEGNLFMVMEYVKGDELKEIIRKNSQRNTSLTELLSYAIQITEGLNTAHNKGIIHRDIKSSNIMLSDDGRIRIMDFGLAHINGDPHITKKGSTPGTTTYMSPEQLRGEEIDFRSDIWSLGIVLFEMLTGQPPFQGNFEQAIIYSILHEKPKPLKKLNPNIPDELEKIVLRCLEKDRIKRFQSAEDLLECLTKVKNDNAGQKTSYIKKKRWISALRKPVYFSVVVISILLAISFLLPIKSLFNNANLPEIQHQLRGLVNNEQYFEAHLLAEEYKNLLENDSVFNKLKLFIYDTLSVSSEPEGAKVYILRYNTEIIDTSIKAEYIGETPLKDFPIIRGDYLVSLEKSGEGIKISKSEYLVSFKNIKYAPVQRIASSYPVVKEFPVPVRRIKLDVKLIESDKLPKNMVFVPGGSYKVVSSSIPLAENFLLNDYYIDKYEVSNGEFKEFVLAGGYGKKELWKFPFTKEGKELPWSEGMKLFVDRTNLPGPRNWEDQNYPEGKSKYPVTDITWYEAAAYAEFIGKSLPSVYQWEKAARNGVPNYHSLSMPWGVIYTLANTRGRINFNSQGTEPVDKYKFGISYYGCYNIAGNVEEWCLNRSMDGFIYADGSFEDSNYVFGTFNTYDGFYSSVSMGFRCVKNLPDSKGDQGGMIIDLTLQIPVYKPVPDAKFESIFKSYNYEKKQLNPQIILSEESEFWIKEKVSFDSPYGDKIMGYLFLPKNTKRPYQCIVWNPHGGVYYLGASADWAAEILFSEIIKDGRALFVLVPKGSRERKWEYGDDMPDISSSAFHERVKRWVIEQRIGLDYLATRGDINIDKLAYINNASYFDGFIVPGLEPRFKCIIIVATGIINEDQKNIPADINPVNFIPRYNAPTYMLNGKYDEAVHFYLSALPAYNLLPEPKKIEAVNTSHVPPKAYMIPLFNKWLNESLGQVKLFE